MQRAIARSGGDKGRHECGSRRVKQGQKQDRGYTATQHLRGRNPCECPRSLSAGERSPLGWQGFVCLWLQRQPGRDDGGREEPIATATVSRRWAQRRLGGKEAIIILRHRAGSQGIARGGVSCRPDAWAQPGGQTVAPAENVLQSRLARRCPMSRVGVQADHTGSHNAPRRARNVCPLGFISRSKRLVHRKGVQWVPWPGPARRRGFTALPLRGWQLELAGRNRRHLENRGSNLAWMHAAAQAWRCGRPADSSDSAAVAAGAATPSLSPHRRRPDSSARLKPGPVPTGDSDSPGVAGQCHCYLPFAASGPSSGQPQCHGTRCRLCSRTASGSPLPFITHRAEGVGRLQCGTTAGAWRLARLPLVSLPARQVSTSRRHAYEHPERTFSKAAPTRIRPGWRSV